MSWQYLEGHEVIQFQTFNTDERIGIIYQYMLDDNNCDCFLVLWEEDTLEMKQKSNEWLYQNENSVCSIFTLEELGNPDYFKILNNEHTERILDYENKNSK